MSANSQQIKKYAMFGVDFSPFGSQHTVVKSQITHQSRVIPNSRVQILLECKHFDNIENHARRICANYLKARTANNPGILSRILRMLGASNGNNDETIDKIYKSQIKYFKAILSEFVTDSFMISEDEIISYIKISTSRKTTKPEDESNCITVIGMTTFENPELLKKSLTSYLCNIDDDSKQKRFVVVDDSRDSTMTIENEKIVRDISNSNKVDITYCGRSKRKVYIRDLSRYADIPYDILAFALLGDFDLNVKTYGASRNTLLCDSLGELSVQVDDDTLCTLGRHKNASDGYRLISADNKIMNYISAESDVDIFLSDVATDYCKVHEKMLGKHPGKLILSNIDNVDFDGSLIYSTYIDSLMDDKPNVYLTFLGTSGDTGSGIGYHKLFARDNFLPLPNNENNKYIDELIESDNIYRFVIKPTIANSRYCVGMNMGIDHRAPLPPFMPILRGEDGVFDTVLQNSFHGVFRGILPECIQHLPKKREEHNGLDIELKSFSLNTMLSIIIDRYNEGYGLSHRMSMSELGNHLIHVSDLSDKSITSYLSDTMYVIVNALVSSAEMLIEKYESSPQKWADKMHKFIESSKRMVTNEQLCYPHDIDGNNSDKLAALRSGIKKYGETLVHWETIMAAVGDMKKNGNTIGK